MKSMTYGTLGCRFHLQYEKSTKKQVLNRRFYAKRKPAHGGQKKPQHIDRGLNAYSLSHVKAPLQGGKSGWLSPDASVCGI
jgi:hypothetical protein